MKNIVFFTLSFISLIFFASCEKNLEKGGKISQISEINFFEGENFLASVASTGSINSTGSIIGTGSGSGTGVVNIYSENKNKWVRDCVEEDFRCAGASDNCKYGLLDNVGGCNFGCGEGNSNVKLRKDFNGKNVWCNDKSASGSIAKENAALKCGNNFYVEAKSAFNPNASFCNSSKICGSGEKEYCICGGNNKWNLSGNLVQTSCGNIFCETEGELKVKNTNVSGFTQTGYYLSKCQKTSTSSNVMQFLPDDSEKGNVGFSFIGGVECMRSSLGEKSFYMPAIGLGECRKVSLNCVGIGENRYIWLNSAYGKVGTGENEISISRFNNESCVLTGSLVMKEFLVLGSGNKASSGGIIEIESDENTLLGFKIISKNYEGVIVPWSYKVQIDNLDVRKISVGTGGIIGSDLIGSYLMLGNEYNVVVTPAKNTTISGEGDIEEIVYDDEKSITVKFKYKEDSVPNIFSFSSLADQEIGKIVESEFIEISGINIETNISIDHGEYKIEGSADWLNEGTISNGQKVRVRHITSSDYNADKISKLTIGGKVAEFKTTTMSGSVSGN